VPAQPRQRLEAPARLPARREPDEHHEDRHDGDGHHEHDRRGHVARHDEREDRDGDDHRERHLRQPAREPRLERVDALDRRGHQFAHALAAQARRPRAQHVRGEPAAQLRHRAHRAEPPAGLHPRGRQAPRERHAGQRDERPAHLGELGALHEDARHHAGDERGLGDDERRRRAAERDRDRHVHAGGAARAQEPAVGALRGVRHRSVAGSPRTASIGLRAGAKSSALRRWRKTQ
jgi:hypothetical protein